MTYILGITGNIASGKTTVGLMLLQLGAQEYIDADRVVHELYLPGRPLVAELTATFGPDILDEAGGVDRGVLGSMVFAQPEKLRRLESLVHPAVQAELLARLRQVNQRGPDAVVVFDAVKLVESGYGQLLHALWLVTCPPDIQLDRLIRLRGLDREAAELRLQAQPDPEPKRALADEVIENSGDLEALYEQVSTAWKRFAGSIQAAEA